MPQALASSDIDPSVQSFWRGRWGIHEAQTHGAGWFADMLDRDNKRAVAFHGRPDLYVAGFPCPAFSAAGLNQGVNVEKGQFIVHIIKFLRVALPRLMLLENVGW